MFRYFGGSNVKIFEVGCGSFIPAFFPGMKSKSVGFFLKYKILRLTTNDYGFNYLQYSATLIMTAVQDKKYSLFHLETKLSSIDLLKQRANNYDDDHKLNILINCLLC